MAKHLPVVGVPASDDVDGWHDEPELALRALSILMTVLGTIDLIKQLKGEIVGLSFLVELGFLNGRERLSGYRTNSVIGY